MITSYTFGIIEVDGRKFRKDLIIRPDGSIHHPWRRKKGHRLGLSDLEPLLDSPPDILVVGAGAFGLMKPKPGLEAKLAKRGVTLRVMPSKQAAAEYNNLAVEGGRIAACFHLTC